MSKREISINFILLEWYRKLTHTSMYLYSLKQANVGILWTLQLEETVVPRTNLDLGLTTLTSYLPFLYICMKYNGYLTCCLFIKRSQQRIFHTTTHQCLSDNKPNLYIKYTVAQANQSLILIKKCGNCNQLSWIACAYVLLHFWESKQKLFIGFMICNNPFLEKKNCLKLCRKY